MDEHQQDQRTSSNIDDIDMFSLSDENLADLLITKYDYLDSCITNEKFDKELFSNLVMILKFILENGKQLDENINYREQINMYFTLFRNILRNYLKYLPESINLLILRLIEIRASKWKIKSNIEEYYMKKIDRLQANQDDNNNNSNNNRQSNIRQSKSHSDIYNNMTKDFVALNDRKNNSTKMLKMNAKGVYKDEIIINNSDSGKIMGIKGRRIHMIEEISDTIISFQKVSPNAKDRTLIISGYNVDNIEKAKNLIDTTIKKNVSPIPFDHDPHHHHQHQSSLKTNNDRLSKSLSLILADPITNDNEFDRSKKSYIQNHHQYDQYTSSYSNNSFQNSSTMNISNNNLNDSLSENKNTYQFTLKNVNNNNDNNLQIKISDPYAGKKLEQFLLEHNFIDFLNNENKIAKTSRPSNNNNGHNNNKSSSIIRYDRNFLLSLREKANQFDVRMLNDIKSKQESLLRFQLDQWRNE